MLNISVCIDESVKFGFKLVLNHNNLLVNFMETAVTKTSGTFALTAFFQITLFGNG